MRLYLVRHAEAAPGQPDEDRVLTEHGRRQAAELGERLARDGVEIDTLLSSPVLRARQTAALIAEPAGVTPESDPRLGFGAHADGLREAVAGRGETVVVVAHEPDCGTIHASLTGGDVTPFSTCEVRVVELSR
jgi:phosphohistidine phosphatase SixA